MNSELTLTQNHIDPMAKAIEIVGDKLTLKSQRIYNHTYSQWTQFAQTQGFNELDLTYDNVKGFINSADLSKSVKLARLSHMRQLIGIMATFDSRYVVHLQLIKDNIKIKDYNTESERIKTALNRSQIYRLLEVWANASSHLELRNNAMLRTLIFTGMRRSELVALKWSDIDFEASTINVRHGKGDKQRHVIIADNTQYTIDALKALKQAQNDKYTYVFPSMTRGKNNTFTDDKPCSDMAVDRLVKRSALLADLPGYLAPHDLRRTHATITLVAGTNVSDVQAQLGHENPQTTLIYAKQADVLTRKGRYKTGL